MNLFLLHIVRFSQTPLHEELNSSIANYLLAATDEIKRGTRVSPILTLRNKRPSLQKHPKMLKLRVVRTFPTRWSRHSSGAGNDGMPKRKPMESAGEQDWRGRILKTGESRPRELAGCRSERAHREKRVFLPSYRSRVTAART